jgi:hypothetical protein
MRGYAMQKVYYVIIKSDTYYVSDFNFPCHSHNPFSHPLTNLYNNILYFEWYNFPYPHITPFFLNMKGHNQKCVEMLYKQY